MKIRVWGLIVLSAAVLAAPWFSASSADWSDCTTDGYGRFDRHQVAYRNGGKAALKAKQIYKVVTEDRAYRVVDGQTLMATIYHPRATPQQGGNAKKFPVLLQIHGGGWIGGERSQLNDYSQAISAMGMVVISIDYRFAPAHIYPAAPQDISAAADWIDQHSDELKIDRGAGISVFGFSAGAHLSNFFAQTYSGRLPVTRAAIFAGRSDLTLPDLGADYTPIFLGGSVSSRMDLAREASPIDRIPAVGSSSAAQVFLIHQDRDPEIDWHESCRFQRAYLAKGFSSRLILLRDDHPMHGPEGENRQIALQALAMFLGLL